MVYTTGKQSSWLFVSYFHENIESSIYFQNLNHVFIHIYDSNFHSEGIAISYILRRTFYRFITFT